MKLKICGLNNRENILQVLECKPDYIGFIFYNKSPRYIGKLPSQFVYDLSSVKKAGIFVNEPEMNILDIVSRYGLDYVQLHGDETPSFCSAVQKYVPVIKTFQIDDAFDLSALSAYENVCDFFLFDSKSKNYGGSGKSFNHTKLGGYTLRKSMFLSGGIDLNISEQVLYLQAQFPYITAVDVNSRFEIQPGIKDVKKVKLLAEKLKQHELQG